MSARLRSLTGSAPRRLSVAAAALALAAAVSGCTASAGTSGVATGEASAPPSPVGSAEPTVSAARVLTSLPRRDRPVPVDQVVEVRAEQGVLRSVQVEVGGTGTRLRGAMAGDRSTWTATDRLEPGRRYAVRAVAVDEGGLAREVRRTFRTQDLTLDQQTYPSIAPLQGETVGVGMPVILSFDIPVTDRAAIEKHLSVESAPRQPGSWHWISDSEVHWRPRTYWQPGTKVTVHADVNSVHAGNGIYGQESRTTSFTVGDAVVMKVDVPAHEMRVFRNGDLLRTIPISAGKPGFTTRSGVKVIVEKFRTKRMDAATTGISRDDPEYYNIADVEYAQRVTYSGEFIHAAPWSVGSQGSANVSHGCVGMSTDDAAWLYSLTRRGDVVDVSGTDRQMTLTNGFGDWNLSFEDYKKGSALS